MTSEKILEVEDLLKSLSDEMLKLKSASEHYEETRENLQNMCESIDRISVTHQRLADNISQLLAEMEKADLEGKRTREFIQSIHDEADVKQSKEMRIVKSLVLLGVLMEVVVIILILFF